MEPIRGIRVAYGADLADHRLVVVRCARGQAPGPCETIHDGAAGKEALSSLASALARTDTALAGAMPAQESFARWIHTPLNDPGKARRILSSLLDVQMPFPLETCEHTVAAVRRAENKAVDLLAVAARRDDVYRRLAEFAGIGLDPEILDHEGLALWSLSLREAPLERETARIVACVGLEHSTLVIGRGSEPGFIGAHGMRIGQKQLLDAETGDEAARQFVLRVQQVVCAQLPERPSSGSLEWFWTGPGAAAVRQLEEPLQPLGPPRFRAHENSSTFLARALAIRALGGSPLPCNLRGPSTKHPKYAVRDRLLHRRTIRWLSATGIALCVAGAAWQGILQARDHKVQSVLTETARAASGLQNVPRGQELLVTRRVLKDQAELYRPFLAFFRAPPADMIARLLQKCAASDIRLETFSLRPESAAITGSATDWNRCDIPAAALRKAGFATELQRQDAGADDRVHFSIQARREPGGPEQ